MAKRPGEKLAEHIQSVVAKFGRYPAQGREPLDGNEYFSVRPYPDFPNGVPVNRKEERAMRKKYAPRQARLDTASRRRRKESDALRIPPEPDQ